MTNPTGYTELDLVGFTDKGEYSPSANYVQNDIVQYNYVAWRCKVDDTTGITPTEGTNWTVFVGNPPSTSVTGVKGNAETDYRTGDVNLTPANIGAYSKSEVDTALNGKLGTSGASTNTTVAFTSNDLAANTTVKTNTTTNQPSTVAKLSSGETLASMFGKISAMFNNIRKLWNTVGTTAINTAYGTTLTAQMANLKSYNTYSTSETWTGEYWGTKKVYSCMITATNFAGTITSSGNRMTYKKETSISNIDCVLSKKGWWKTSNNTKKYCVGSTFPHYSTLAIDYSDSMFVDSGTVTYFITLNKADAPAGTTITFEITIKYIKTT